MPAVPFSLEQALQSIGNAEVFIGDALVADGMDSLGALDGPATFRAPQTFNNLTAPEQTGEIPHQAQVTVGAVTVEAPLVLGDATIWPKISPIGKSGGGTSSPVSVVETSVLLIPRAELGPLGGTGLAYTTGGSPGWTKNGVTGAESAPKNAIWLWRCYITFGDIAFQYGNGGKVTTPITFHAMFDGSKPEYHKVYTIGDPRAVTPTPIEVLL